MKATILNRYAIILRPRQPIVDWVNSTDPDGRPFTLEGVSDDNAVYLVTDDPEFFDPYEILRPCWNKVFEAELHGWCTDGTKWPQHLTHKMFREWFEAEVHTVVKDVADKPLVSEEF